METGGMKPGDVAGLALFNRPFAWLGVERDEQSLTLVQFDEQTGQTVRVPLKTHRVWLRANCNYLDNTARFSYSMDGRAFHDVGETLKMPYGLVTFQGVRYSMFSYNRNGAEGGFADFDSFTLKEPNPRGLTRPIPYGRQIVLMPYDHAPNVQIGISGNSLVINSKEPAVFAIVDRNLGRIALRSKAGFVSIGPSGEVSLRSGHPEQAETFQWIETFTGEITLMSLATNRYLRIDSENGRLLADSPGPRPDAKDGVRFDWKPAAGR
jgi:xylan 1,4-beta-xylosidase